MDIRLEQLLPSGPGREVLQRTAGRLAAPPDDCCGARPYLERLDRHRFPVESLTLIAEDVQRLLDCDRDRKAIGDLDELREAVERVEGY